MGVCQCLGSISSTLNAIQTGGVVFGALVRFLGSILHSVQASLVVVRQGVSGKNIRCVLVQSRLQVGLVFEFACYLSPDNISVFITPAIASVFLVAVCAHTRVFSVRTKFGSHYCSTVLSFVSYFSIKTLAALASPNISST